MGADGGVITTRRDMVAGERHRQSGPAENERERQSSLSHSHWTECVLTGCPLASPILVDRNGRFFKKAEFLEAIADKTLPKKFNFARRKNCVRELNLLGAGSLIEYSCPLSGKSPSPGTRDSWIVLFGCGHLFHAGSFAEIGMEECPVCGAKFDRADVVDVTSAAEVRR
jgi:hypothetical protein